MTVTLCWHTAHGSTSSLHNKPRNDRSNPLRELGRWGRFRLHLCRGSRPNVNLICCACSWYTVSAIQMARAPDPRVPHPSLQLCDLFFLAGDLDTLHSLAEVRESGNQYPPPHTHTQTRARAHTSALPVPLVSLFFVSFQIYLQEKRKRCDVGVLDVG